MLPETSRQITMSTCWPWSAGLARARPATANATVAATARARNGERNIRLLLTNVLSNHYHSRRSGVSDGLGPRAASQVYSGDGQTIDSTPAFYLFDGRGAVTGS